MTADESQALPLSEIAQLYILYQVWAAAGGKEPIQFRTNLSAKCPTSLLNKFVERAPY